MNRLILHSRDVLMRAEALRVSYTLPLILPFERCGLIVVGHRFVAETLVIDCLLAGIADGKAQCHRPAGTEPLAPGLRTAPPPASHPLRPLTVSAQSTDERWVLDPHDFPIG